MPYQCPACKWIDERDPNIGDAEEPTCHRCRSSAITELTTDELIALFDAKAVSYCKVCQRVHFN